MANMFSEKTEKQVPKTLTDCIKQDATVSNLHVWSERLETFGKILFILLIVTGIISTFLDGITTYQYLEELDNSIGLVELAASGMELPTVGGVVSSSIMKWGFYAFLEYCTYHAVALLISALASITQNTIISANVALYEVAKNFPNCNVPQNTVTPESVIHNTKNESHAQSVTYTPAPEDMWVCKNCGTNNSLNYGQCKKCGKFKS